MNGFIVDAGLPRAAPELRSLGFEAIDVREVGLVGASDGEIARFGRDRGLCILIRDFGFADVRVYPPELYAGIVVFDLPETANRDFILGVLTSLLHERELVDRLAGRLANVETSRVRLRTAD